ncbi:MAG TPA: hypothetical protein PKA19_16280 [Bacillota bacterium]|nr:hypothetical protein [Bacillota bacterium]
MKKKLLALVLALTMVIGLLAGCGAKSSTEEPSTEGNKSDAVSEDTIPTGDWVIGLSNSYYGNTWRKQMVDSFTTVAKEAKEKGYIKDYLIQNGDGSVNAQIR